MDQVSSSMIENLRPTRSLYQKILMERKPGIFSEGVRKARFSARIENCLNQDNDGYVSFDFTRPGCLNIEEFVFFFTMIFLLLLYIMIIYKILTWLHRAVSDLNVPLSQMWKNILK